MSSLSAGDRGDDAGWARPESDTDARSAAVGPVELTKPHEPEVASTPDGAAVHPSEPIWAIGMPAPAIDPSGPDAPPPSADPFAATAPDGSYGPAPWNRTTSTRAWGVEAAVALGVAAALAALAFPLAWVWVTVSPHVVLEMTANGPAYVEANPEEYIAGEGVYLLISVLAGLVSAIAVWLLGRRVRGPILLAGLALGSVVAGAVMARYGHYVDLGDYERLLKEAPVGTRFEVPVKVRSGVSEGPLVQGAMLVQSLIAVAAYTLTAGFYATASLRPDRDPVGPGRDRDPAGPDGDQPKEVPVSSGSTAPSDPPTAPEPPAAG